MFLRIYEHLLPDATAWRLKAHKRLRAFFEGLTEAPAAARDFVDAAFLDVFPPTTRALEDWETQFALRDAGTEDERRTSLDAAWKATGGQSPRYLQDIVQAAGFDLYVHEWWSSGPDPYVARDPRDYTDVPLLGTIQCNEPIAQCGEQEAQCNAFLANDPGYLVNQNLTPKAPPPIPADPAYWPFFVYFGGEIFGTEADVPEARRAELETLLLRICPAHLWIVLIVNWT